MKKRSLDEPPIKPCVQCGYCCKKARCALSLIVEGIFTEENLPTDPFEATWRISRVCPYLRQEKNSDYTCKLVTGEVQTSEKRVNEWLSIGEGCSSSMNSDRRDKLRAKKESRDRAIDKISVRKQDLKRTMRKPV